LGLTLAPAASVAGRDAPGVIIIEVDPAGPAAERGVHAGDIILEVSGKAVNSPSDVRDGLDSARAGGKQAVLMRIRSGETAHYVAMPLAAG
jgi:serine protease Do